MERQTAREYVLQQSIFGTSLTGGTAYGGDKIEDVIAWLQEILADIPEEYRASAKLALDIEDGYEGERHIESEIYFERPETDEEMARRHEKLKASAALDLRLAQQRADEAVRRLRALGG